MDMNKYAVRCLNGHPKFNNDTSPMVLVRGTTAAGTPVELQNNVTDKEYTAWSMRLYSEGDIVVCNFKYGLILCVITCIIQQTNCDLCNQAPFSAPEIVSKVDLKDYMAWQLARANAADAKQHCSHIGGLNIHLAGTYGMRIHKEGYLEILCRLSHGSCRDVWLVADPYDTQVLLRNSVSFAAAWRIAEERLTARGLRPTYDGIYRELAKKSLIFG